LHPAIQYEGEVQPCADEFHDHEAETRGMALMRTALLRQKYDQALTERDEARAEMEHERKQADRYHRKWMEADKEVERLIRDEHSAVRRGNRLAREAQDRETENQWLRGALRVGLTYVQDYQRVCKTANEKQQVEAAQFTIDEFRAVLNQPPRQSASEAAPLPDQTPEERDPEAD
jgi:hypothetical protein